MSHFTVLVFISPEEMDTEGLDTVLERKLAPFNENEPAPRYKSFEDGSPSEHWLTKSLELGPDPTWADWVVAHNKHYGYGTEVSVSDDDGDSGTMYMDEETGRAFSWSTYNPNSKWDWWSIGGRWQRSFKTIANPDPDYLIHGTPGAFGDNGRPELNLDGSVYCDGGQLRFLDLDGMRDEQEQDQLKKYDKYWALVAEFGAPTTWASLLEGINELEGDERNERLKKARDAYNNQRIVQACQKAELTYVIGETAEAIYGMSREDFIAQARLEAVPGYAMLSLTGEWAAPGNMGWFGISSESLEEQEAFRVQMNRYIDALPKDNWVVLLDCHI